MYARCSFFNIIHHICLRVDSCVQCLVWVSYSIQVLAYCWTIVIASFERDLEIIQFVRTWRFKTKRFARATSTFVSVINSLRRQKYVKTFQSTYNSNYRFCSLWLNLRKYLRASWKSTRSFGATKNNYTNNSRKHSTVRPDWHPLSRCVERYDAVILILLYW